MQHGPGCLLTVQVVDRHEYGQIIAAAGEVDATTAPQLAEALRRVLAEQPSRVVVDLSEVTFMDAAGTTVLLQANTAAWPDMVFVVIACGAAARPLQLAGLESTMAVYPHRALALACTADLLPAY